MGAELALGLDPDAPADEPPPAEAKRFEELRSCVELETLLAEFEELMVTAVVDEEEDEEEDEAEELAPLEETRLPVMLPRLPSSRGAVMAANRSAPIDPPTRMVWCRSPTATTAVRIAAPDGPPPSFGAILSPFR